LLPPLHQWTLEVTGGSCSVLFAYDARAGRMQATSGFALDELRTESWIPGLPESTLVNDAFTRRTPILVADATRQAPDLAERLGGVRAAMIVPLAAGHRRIGLLAVGFRSPPRVIGDTSEIADAFLLATELFRLRQEEVLQQDLRELLDEFGATVSATLDIGAGLDIICHRANRLFGADRTSVWIHDRSSRHLALRASSDRQHLSIGMRVSTGDMLAPAAAALRRSRSAAVGGETSTRIVTIPLRGCRRALGALVLDGVRVEPGGEHDLLDRANELGRQLSSAVDSLQLLDDVLESRRELESLLDSMPYLIVIVDHRGRIVHANEPFAHRLGLTRERLRSRPLTDCVGPELAAWLAVQTQGPARLATGATASREMVDPVLDGPFVVTVADRLDRDHNRAGFLMIARDLTPGSHLDAEREEQRQRLAQADKLAALGQFVAGIAHELNNPLQGVLGHVELLRATRALPRPLRPAIRAIYREADRAAKIVRSLLAFTGARRMARRAVNLQSVLQRALALRQAACQAGQIEVVRHYAAEAPRVFGDPFLLHQVFLNMIMNAEDAIRAARRAGRIEITTAVADSGDRVVTTIRDTGEGIRTEALPRIFEPFYTTKDVGEGMGLGLALAYGIIQEHGGAISAANHPDGGAVITVDLPAAPRERSRD
jgi:PAS domain S-box-containing protein